MPDSNHEADGDQVRRAAKSLIREYGAVSVPMKPEIPPTLKWAGAIVGAIMTAGSLALAVWLISTVNAMQVTLARMDERQVLQSQNLADRFQAIDERLGRLEALKEKGAR